MRDLTQEALDEGGDDFPQLILQLLAEGALLLDLGQELLLIGLEVGKEVSLPLQNLVDRNGVEVAVDASKDDGNHLVDGVRRVLLLLEELGQL